VGEMSGIFAVWSFDFTQDLRLNCFLILKALSSDGAFLMQKSKCKMQKYIAKFKNGRKGGKENRRLKSKKQNCSGNFKK